MANGNKPKAAGILNIISGAFALLGFIILLIAIPITSGAFGIPGTEAIPAFVPTILWIIAIPTLAIGVLEIIGGIYALQKKLWGLALAGSILAIIAPVTVLGIISTIFISISKDEFE
ncbi:MAG: hypothetical protein JSV25_07030 [Spirochaetota bacterium]|nr:MAG: hypothetical protein JSV25_07030 [Spirochaetota bacterium]